MTPRRCNCAAHILTAARLDLNSPAGAPKNWRHINWNLTDYDSDPMEINSTFWLLDITNWWHQQEEMHSKYADLSNVACDIFPIIPHGVRVEDSFSLGCDVIDWRQSKTTGETLWEKVVVRQLAQGNNGIFAGDYTALDPTQTENNLQLKRAVEESIFDRMAKVHNVLEMWQGSRNLRATHKESRAKSSKSQL